MVSSTSKDPLTYAEHHLSESQALAIRSLWGLQAHSPLLTASGLEVGVVFAVSPRSFDRSSVLGKSEEGGVTLVTVLGHPVFPSADQSSCFPSS